MQLGTATNLAELTFTQMLGIRALGHYRLRFDFMAHVREQSDAQRVKLFAFSGDLQVRDTSNQSLPVARVALASPQYFIQSYSHSNTQSITFEADLDRYRIEAIEEARRGGDLLWTLTVRAQAEQEGQLQSLCNSMSIQLNKGQWIDILSQFGYRDTLLLELPLASTKNRDLNKALKHLKGAYDALERGSYRDAVAMCRDALEPLTAIAGDDRDATFENSRFHTKQERLLLLRKALKKLPHAAKHAETGDEVIEWDRADAAMLVFMTAAMLRRYIPA